MRHFPRARWFFAPSLACGLALSHAARAEPSAPQAPVATPAETANAERARSLFEQAVKLSEAGNWEDAASAFAQSAELQANATCLLNLAVARYQTKRPIEGLDALDRLARLGDLPEDAQARAGAIRSKLESQVAQVTVSVSPASADLFVDGHVVPGSAPERVLRLDPGPHAIALTSPGYRGVTRDLDVAAGPLRMVLALAPARAADVAVAAPAPAKEESRSVLKSPWLWGGVGVVVGVVTAAVIASSSGTASPNGGSERKILSP